MTDTRAKAEMADLLMEALDLLDDLKGKLGLFERQQYWKLKRKVEHLTKLNTRLKHSLYNVECLEDEKLI